MKQAAFALMVLLAVACASSKAQNGKPARPDVAIDVEQVVGPAQLNYPYGPMEVQYEFLIQNPSAQPITLTRIARGIPAGGGLESADELTLAAALSGRTRL